MNGASAGSLGSARPWRRRIHVLAARVADTLGGLGVVGLGLLLVAALWLAWAWKNQREYADNMLRTGTPPPMTIARIEPVAVAQLNLPTHSEIASLLARIALEARDSDLGWPGAEYRINAATADRLATLEVRCTIRAPYPKLRRFLVQVSNKVPGATIRELQMSRPSSEAVDVEAKLVLQVFLDDEQSAVAGTLMKTATP